MPLGRLWKRFLSRHTNTVDFWFVLVFVALMLLLVTGVLRRSLGFPGVAPGQPSEERSP